MRSGAAPDTSLSPLGLPVLSDRDIALGFPYREGAIRPARPRAAASRKSNCRESNGRDSNGRDSNSRDSNGRESNPQQALRSVLAAALRRPPCLVSFSGGRDSSLLLALTRDVAARHGLEPPIAITFRYPGDPDALESTWQELVINHLNTRGLSVEWERRDITDEFDIVGPLVAPVLERHGGPLWPPALGSVLLLARMASGGSVITGEFGDEVLGGHRANVLRTVAFRRGRGLSRSAWGTVALTLAPRTVRRAVLRSRVEVDAWLRPELRRAKAELEARETADRPLRWDRSVRAALQTRAITIGRRSISALAGQAGCNYVEPLADPGFIDALASAGRPWGIGGRSAGLRLLADGLLPDAVIDRVGKAYFNASRFGPATAAFAQGWDGTGLNEELVDPAALRRLWQGKFVPAQSAMLLHQAWLHGRSRSATGRPVAADA